jgi:hypothetical protein
MTALVTSAQEFLARYRRMNPASSVTLLRDLAMPVISSVERATGAQATVLSRPHIQILILHHVFPDEMQDFRRLLEDLAGTYRFVS